VFDFLPAPLSSIVPFVIALGILVFIHELGHYLAARAVGVHVEAFSIGFGNSVLRWKDRRGCEWRIGWLPLGGYVKLHGQEQPTEAGADVKAAWIPGKTFHEQRVAARALVIAAGPIANFLLAAVLFIGLFGFVGRVVPLSTPLVSEVSGGGAAASAGMRIGDRIDAIGGVPTPTVTDVIRIVSASPDKALALTVHRGTADVALTATPMSEGDGAKRVGKLGISLSASRIERVSWASAVPDGLARTWNVTTGTLDGVWQVITGRVSVRELGGPVRIAQLSGQFAAEGIVSLIGLIALLSVNLGLMNLFPIPVLDGGHLLFFLAEAIRGRPLPARALDYSLRAGVAAIAALFVVITVNDLSRMGLFHWVAGLVGQV